MQKWSEDKNDLGRCMLKDPGRFRYSCNKGKLRSLLSPIYVLYQEIIIKKIYLFSKTWIYSNHDEQLYSQSGSLLVYLDTSSLQASSETRTSF